MKQPPEQIRELGDEHADGSWYADITGDLWTICPNGCGWMYTRRVPFAIGQGHGLPDAEFGPYVKVLDAAGKPVA